MVLLPTIIDRHLKFMSSVSAVITFLKKLSKQAAAERSFLIHCITSVPHPCTIITECRGFALGMAQ